MFFVASNKGVGCVCVCVCGGGCPITRTFQCLCSTYPQRFDFPLLARHLVDAGVVLSDLEEVWCADTLRAFREVFKIPYYKLRQVYINACGKQPRDIHSAEDDSEMLMNIVHCKDTQFLITWFNNQSKPQNLLWVPP